MSVEKKPGRRGRPLGSKNKPKDSASTPNAATGTKPKQRKKKKVPVKKGPRRIVDTVRRLFWILERLQNGEQFNAKISQDLWKTTFVTTYKDLEVLREAFDLKIEFDHMENTWYLA